MEIWERRYVFFNKEVDETCPNCGAKKMMHYSWNDLTDDSAHYRSCMNSECKFDERIGFLSAPCNTCGYEGSDCQTGSFEVKLKCCTSARAE